MLARLGRLFFRKAGPGFLAVVVFGAYFQSQPVRADDFEAWVRDFWPSARAAGISPATYQAAFTGVRPDPAILKSASYQPEFVRPVGDYLESAVSERRIQNGRQKLAEYRRFLDVIEARFGVDRHIVVAIWGMESAYGAVLENPNVVKSVVRSLATLAYGDKRRQKYARQQLIAALKILQRGDISLNQMRGSWAGAMGHTQFIPTTYQAYAVDFDGDGRRDIWNFIPDALASTANYLEKAGWQTGKTWGYEVILPRRFNYALADEGAGRSLAEWERLGIRRAHGRTFPRPSDEAVLVLPSGAEGPAFLMLKNFRVIKRYNNSTSYALAVGHLADRLRGGAALATPWPQNVKPLTREERIALQEILRARGLYKGKIDGKIGSQSRAAIRQYQIHLGLAPDGFASSKLLERLRGG